MRRWLTAKEKLTCFCPTVPLASYHLDIWHGCGRQQREKRADDNGQIGFALGSAERDQDRTQQLWIERGIIRPIAMTGTWRSGVDLINKIRRSTSWPDQAEADET